MRYMIGLTPMPATPVFDGVLSGAGSGQLELIIILVQASSRIGRQLSKREESKGGGGWPGGNHGFPSMRP